MKRYAVLSVLLLLALCPFACSEETDGKEVSFPDGVSYTYTTHGSDYPTYMAVMVTAETSDDIMFLSTTLEGYNVKEIAPNALSGRDVESVVIPERVEVIGEGAFDGCPKLRTVYFMGDRPSVSLPEGVEVLRMPGTSGWDDDTGLLNVTEVDCSGSRVSMAEVCGRNVVVGAVPDADGNVTIPNSADLLGAYAFAGGDNPEGTAPVPRTDIRSVSVPEGVTELRERCFYYNSGLEHITFPSTLKVIRDEAFRADPGLCNVDLPDGLEYIGFEAFRQCGSFTEVVIPDSVGFVGEGAYKICRGTESLSIGSGLDSLPSWGFAYMDSLSELTISGNPVSVGSQAFYMCGSLTDAVLPGSVQTLGTETFMECTSLRTVSLGESLEVVGNGAFKGCSSLDGPVLPETLRGIGDKAFAYCSSLEDIYFGGDMPELGRGVFLNAPVTVHIQPEHADSWSGFDGIVAVDGESKGFPTWVVIAIAIAVLFLAVLSMFLVRKKV